MKKLIQILIVCGLFVVMVETGSDAQDATIKGPAAEVPKMKVSDVFLDFKSLIGKKIHVPGFLITIGDLQMLYDNRGDLNALTIDSGDLSRDDRKYILEKCTQGCRLEFIGIVEDSLMGKGLKVEKLIKMSNKDKGKSIVKELWMDLKRGLF